MVKLASLAEGYGFSHIWFPDEKWMRSPWQNAATVAYATKKMGACVACANIFYRHPVVIANEAHTLAELSGGRSMIALCPGGQHAIKKLGYDWNQLIDRLRTVIEVVKPLLSGAAVSTRTKDFTVDDVTLGFSSPRTPVLLTALGPKMIQLASRVADGVLLDAAPLAVLPQIMEWVREGLDETGRSMKDFFIANLMPLALVTEDYNGVLGSKYFSVWQIGASHSYIQDALSEFREDMRKVRAFLPDQTKAAEAMSDEVFKAFAITGNPSECVRQLNTYSKVGVNHVAVMLPKQIPYERTVQAIGETVLAIHNRQTPATHAVL